MKRIVGFLMVVALLVGLVIAYRTYLVHSLRANVLMQLNDPDSAQFRNEVYVGPWTMEKGVLCGQVNSKNRMGGYVGFKAFSATSKDALIMSEPDDLECDALANDENVPWWWLR